MSAAAGPDSMTEQIPKVSIANVARIVIFLPVPAVQAGFSLLQAASVISSI
ncbi:hypothetical protein [Ferrovibrio sp.]|uniref:hypothetical protein n=1 Tax=Ferrovibrio sp. TaxID=1917215 RepID=UPI00260A7ED8|nr:hypothetical protein [Ferrovibrio sp.]